MEQGWSLLFVAHCMIFRSPHRRMLSRQCSLVSKRCASAAAAVAPRAAVLEQKVSRMPNGLSVASVDLHGAFPYFHLHSRPGAVSQLVIAFRAGSRFESPDESGITHYLRNAVGCDTHNYLGTQLLWQAGGAGANLVATTTRDLFLVQMSVLRDQAPMALSLLGEFAAQPAFKPWDLEDNMVSIADYGIANAMQGNLQVDRASRSPFDRIMEYLHEAAYRTGPLGNPILARRHRIGAVSFRQLQKFAEARLVTGEAAITGINVAHDLLLHYAAEQAPILPGQAKPAASSPYKGGEWRKPGAGALAHVAIAGQGASLQDPKAIATQAVLMAAAGQGPLVKCASNAGQGVVARAVQKSANQQPFGVSAFSLPYTDQGLAGVYLVAEGERIAPLVAAAVAGLRQLASTPLDDAALKGAKAVAEVNVLLRAESSTELAMDQATQVLATGSVMSPAELVKLINAVSAADVSKAASTVVAKMSMSSYGRIDQVPYLDEL